MLDQTFVDKLDLKELATQLKENFELRGGGDKKTLTGGGGKFDASLQKFIVGWFKKK